MASTAATLATFGPNDTEVYDGAQVAIRRVGPGQLACLPFQGKQVGAGNSTHARWGGTLPRGPAGFSATTGIKALVGWSAPPGAITGQAVVWGGSFQLCGQADTPDPKIDNFPAAGSANEIRATTVINSSVPGGMNYTLLTIPLAAIKNGQTSAAVAGDKYRFQLRRCLEQVADTLIDDAYLHSVELYDY